jgi:hypothetical protein
MSEVASAAPAPEDIITTAPEGADNTAPGNATETGEDVETEALAMGWKPRSEFKGPDDKFVEAAEYVERGKTIMPFLRKELAGAYKKIEGLEKAVKTSIQHISKAEQRAYVKARADLDAELAHYAAAGDAANAKAVTDEIEALEKDVIAKAEPEADGNPDFDAWRSDNPWFGKDKALTAACGAIGQEVAEEGYTGKAQIKEVDRRIREAFPEKFAKPENANRRLPGAVEAGGAPRARAGKSYSDLPPEARQMCDELVRDKILTREQYVKTYDFGA